MYCARVELRDYQLTAVSRLRAVFARGVKRIVLVLPTGTGKTQCFLEAARSALSKGNRVLILACQKELIDQPSRKLDALGIDHGIIMAGNKRSRPDLPIQVASVPTLVRRNLRPPANVVILDEAHMANARTISTLLSHYSDAAIIGCTATPERLDGRGLGEIFQEIVEGITFREAVEQGYLVPVRTFAPPGADVSAVAKSHGDFKQDELAAAKAKLAKLRMIQPGG